MTGMSDSTAPRARARTASASELMHALPEAGAAYLLEAMDNPNLTEEHVVLIARSRAAPERLLDRLASDPEWVRSYQVKAALVRNPHTPRHRALNLVKFLFWRDLAQVADDFFLAPPLRRLAERMLGDRIPELALGEKVALARVSGRGLIPRLLVEREALVQEALLWNGRVTEQDLLKAINDPDTTPETLAAMGRHPRWAASYAVRLALLRSSRTPLWLRLGLLTSMIDRDLTALAESPETPKILKLACERVLADESWRRRKASEEA